MDKNLAAETRRMDTVVAAMPDGLVIYARDGKIQYLNPAAEKLLGLSSDQAAAPVEERLRGLKVLDASGNPVAPEQQPVTRVLRGEAVFHEVLILDGPPPLGRRSVSVSAVPIPGPDGTVDGVVVSLVDVTRLQQVQEQRDDLVRMVSHDLRTPLSALLLQAQMLQRSLQPRDGHGKRVATIIANGQRLATMIRDLVEVVRLESGQFQLMRKPIDVQRFTTDLCERLAETLPTERLRLSSQPRLPVVSADPERLERMLVHLLSNALKYSDASAEVGVHASCADGFVTIAVTDHGVGIARQELPHAFERRCRSNDSVQQESLGLGLYITALLVRAHGGRIEVESELGQGSVFRVHLPASST
ncbi:MAG TPA: ATP-binding protein [Polyangia bacterium]|nr:ATP-binding protein [Polyangia bacterium]